MRRKSKMTKNEAMNIALSVTCGVNSNDIINVLEALELIRFDKKKSVVDEAKIYARNYTLYDRQELAGVIDMLIRHIEK